MTSEKPAFQKHERPRFEKPCFLDGADTRSTRTARVTAKLHFAAKLVPTHFKSQLPKLCETRKSLLGKLPQLVISQGVPTLNKKAWPPARICRLTPRLRLLEQCTWLLARLCFKPSCHVLIPFSHNQDNETKAIHVEILAGKKTDKQDSSKHRRTETRAARMLHKNEAVRNTISETLTLHSGSLGSASTR